MSTFSITTGDRLPALVATLSPLPSTLVGATVVLRLRSEETGLLTVDAPGAVLSATNGTVQYDWGVSDTDTVGVYRGEFVVTFATGRQETFPSPGFFSVHITPRV